MSRPLALLGAAAGLLLAGCSSTPDVRPVPEGVRPLAAAPEVVDDAVVDADSDAATDAVAATDGGPATDGGSATDGGPTAPTRAEDVQVRWPEEVEGVAEAVVATVAGRSIGVGELVSKWVMRDPDAVRGLLDDLILSRIVLLEAAALGLQPPAEDVERLVNQRLDALEAQARAAGAPDLATFIRARLGFEPDPFLRQLNEEAAIDALAPRCVRAWLLANDRREVRAITVEDRSAVDEVQARLARGEAFDAVARALSTDGSSEEGGRVPALVRGESVLARTAFAAEVGDVAGPVREGEAYLFVLVEAAPAPLDGPWTRVGAAVDTSLAARPVEDPEFWQWKEAMTRRYDVDTEPFLGLIR